MKRNDRHGNPRAAGRESFTRGDFLRGAAAFSALAASPALLASCGGSGSSGASEGSPNGITLTLDWYPNADHAGIYMARSLGLFKEAGLDVEIQQPSDPASVLQLVAAGRSEFGISYETEITNAAVRDIPVVSVMAVMQHPLNSLMSLRRTGISGPADLTGRKVGYAGQSFGSAVLDTVLREAGEDPASLEKINVGYDLRPALTSGRVDAIVDAYWNIEAVEMEEEGFEVDVIRLEDVGVPNYNELVVATANDYAGENPQVVRDFVAALVEGHRAATEDPEEAANALVAASPELDEQTARRTTELTVPIFSEPGRPVGFQPPDEWRAYVAWAVENDVLPQSVEVEQVMTNEYLPDRG
ncbi:ABC transporter substrate-binding protein [Rubrobacter indicoceani]|uniref:ABC transporter substrate-binding protein n=1 Tax=Rubrobacter indicoceani TaxID=2051957 RepID=UPI000E5A5F48|nr:ABC transporter substrate-binding protein [Rubrobacter indicoceani]